MIQKKHVRKFAKNGAHIIVPGRLVGEEVYIVTEDAVRELEELVTVTLLYRKAQSFEQTEMKKEMNEFQANIEARIEKLERIFGKN